MRRGLVKNHGRLAGVLEELDDGRFRFTYNQEYLLDEETSGVSLTLPKRAEPYYSSLLFPFFFGLLAEGSTRELQSRLLRIDEEDSFGLLLATGHNTIGSVSVEKELK